MLFGVGRQSLSCLLWPPYVALQFSIPPSRAGIRVYNHRAGGGAGYLELAAVLHFTHFRIGIRPHVLVAAADVQVGRLILANIRLNRVKMALLMWYGLIV